MNLPAVGNPPGAAANIQCWPTPEIFINPSHPHIVEVTPHESGSESLALSDAVYTLVLIPAPDQSESGSGALALVDATYVASGAVIGVSADESGSSVSALVGAAYVAVVIPESETESGKNSTSLTDAVYFEVIVTVPTKTENAKSSTALTGATYL